MAQTIVAPTHVSNSFEFVLQEPLSRAAPLFGPQGELCWAGEHWKPEFVHPQPGEDVQGAVFTVPHGPHKSVWVNTIFDLAGGRMQYVALIPEIVVFTVDVRLTALNASSTNVAVTYARTALDGAANTDVEAMGKKDRESGLEWKRDIESCLKGQGKGVH
ncbi:MAG TPA: hypothetical protein VIX42_06310 [Edaphobacter sp.]